MGESPWKTQTHLIRIGDSLGEGCYGIVWKAEHTVEKCQYAIKQAYVDKALRRFGGNVETLLAEVKLLADIQSKNVVRYHTCWLEGPGVDGLQDKTIWDPQKDCSSYSAPPEERFIFIQMELCDSTLEKWMETRPSLETRTVEIPHILIQLALALTEIHERNIIHRDLKPDNIFLKITKVNQVNFFSWKIGDLGLAKRAPQVNTEMSVAGCLAYQSPEKQNTLMYDVYSLGLIFLKVLHPLPSAEYKSKFYDWRETPSAFNYVQEVSNLIAKTHPKECEIICQMLNPSPDERITAQRLLNLVFQIYDEEILSKYPFQRVANQSTFPALAFIKSEPTNRPWEQKKHIQHGEKTQPYLFQVRKTTASFVGRELEIKQLRRKYIENELIVVVTGLGGIGKTELVRHFVQIVYQDLQGSCIWLKGENEASLRKSIEDLAREQLIEKDDDICPMLKKIYEKLSHNPIVIVIDNVDIMNSQVQILINNFKEVPQDTGCPLIVITTRNREVFSQTGGEFIELKVLDDIDAEKLVTKSLPKAKSQDVTNLCKTLHNFPLTLQQAICCIELRQKTSKFRFGIPEYLKLFNEKKQEILDLKLTLAKHDYSLTTLTTWQISFDSIKEDEKLGTMAEKIFNTWAYALNPDGENLQFIVSFIEDVESVNNPEFRSNYRKVDTKNKIDEIDILDDPRPVAQAIQLIRTYSMCNVDLIYSFGSDEQYVDIHRLVLEVIRVKKSEEEEVGWLSDFGKSLLNLCSHQWSGTREFETKKRILINTWPFISKCPQLISDLKGLLLAIFDADVYLPLADYEFLFKTQKQLREVLSPTDHLALTIEYHYWKVALLYEKIPHYVGKIKIQDLFEFIKREIPILGHAHTVTASSLDLMAHDIITRALGPPLCLSIENAEQVLKELIQSYQILEPELPQKQLLLLLGVTGRILEEFVAQGEQDGLIRFASTLLETFKEKGYENYLYIPLFKYIAYFISDIAELPDESANFISNLTSILNIESEDLRLDCDELHRVNKIGGYSLCHVLPSSVLNKFLIDLTDSACGGIDASGVYQILRVLSKTCGELGFKYVRDFGKKALRQSLELCQKSRFFSDIDSFIIAAKYAEEIVRKSGMRIDYIDMCKAIVPLFEFKDRLNTANLIFDWINDLIARIDSDSENNFYDIPISIIINSSDFNTSGILLDINNVSYENFPAWIAGITDPNVLNKLGEVILKSLDSSIPLMQTVALIGDRMFRQQDYSNWQSFLQRCAALLCVEQQGMQGYLNSLIAKHISKVLSPTQGIPTPIAIWGFIFLVKHHGELSTSNCHIVIQEIVATLESENGQDLLETIFNIGLKVAEVCANKLKSMLSQGSNFWYYLHSLAIVGKGLRKAGRQDQELDLFRISLGLRDNTPKINIIKSLLSKFQTRWVKNVDNPSWEIVVTIVVSVVVQVIKDGALDDKILVQPLTNLFQDLLDGFYFKNAVILSDELMDVRLASVESYPILNSFSVQEIAKRLRLAQPRHQVVEYLSLFKSALRVTKRDDTRNNVNSEVLRIISQIIENEDEDYEDGTLSDDEPESFVPFEGEELFLFVLRHGPESENNMILVHKILDYYLESRKYAEMYWFGGAVSYVRKSKLRLESLCLEAIDKVVEYLRMAWEEDAELFKRVFTTLDRYEIHEFNNRGEFDSKVGILCKELELDYSKAPLGDADYWSDSE